MPPTGVASFPDHQRLLLNAVHWARGDAPFPVTMEGEGLLDVAIWKGGKWVAVHLVNLTTPDLFGGPIKQVFPLSEQQVYLRLPDGTKPQRALLLRRQEQLAFSHQEDTLKSNRAASHWL